MTLLEMLTKHVPRDRNTVLRAGSEQFDEWFKEPPATFHFYDGTEPRKNMIFGPTLVVRDETLPPSEYKLEDRT